ncbi:hypothetical protein LCGC14_0349880 [marine sediment metagenome]|uniref:Uncharacterized protein n=1 Tax=marine sediment metagenome TaxID=412755 RepID=A0A0F9VYG1_9ZZZZ
MKVALVVPNFRWCETDKNTLWHYIPYNLCLLASVIRDRVDVSIIDAYKDDMTEKEFSRKLRKLEPDIVGITMLFDQYAPSAHKVAELTKKVSRKIKTVMGGVYATTNPEKVLEDCNIDCVIEGEGEEMLPYLLGLYERGEWLKQEHLVGGRIKNLDDIPLPAYDLIGYKKYINSAPRKSVDTPRPLPFARIMASRGCPFGCAFCQVETIMGAKFRPRSVSKVLDEMQWLKERYGIKSIIFDDDNLLYDMDRAKELFQGMIDRDLVMPWSSLAVAVFKMDKELVGLMKASGCQYLAVAIESGTDRVLKEIIKKPVNFQHAREMIKAIKEAGIYIVANFIVGFPTETWEEIRQTIEFAEEIDVDYIKLFHAVPLPHTRLWDLCEQENAFGGNGHFVWSKGNIRTREFTPEDLTILRAYEWDRINFTNPEKRKRTAEMMEVTLEELDEIRKETRRNACDMVGVK